jgi:hypothetical protein
MNELESGTDNTLIHLDIFDLHIQTWTWHKKLRQIMHLLEEPRLHD